MGCFSSFLGEWHKNYDKIICYKWASEAARVSNAKKYTECLCKVIVEQLFGEVAAHLLEAVALVEALQAEHVEYADLL